MSFLLRYLRSNRRLLINSEKLSGFGSSSQSQAVGGRPEAGGGYL